jgi:transcription initiation factor TFIIIB Brf1 subunit/transcription initiation factor TFIIB
VQFSEIEEKFQSQGDRILHDLNEKGIISIPTKINPIYDYINRYFEILNIDSKYKAFVIDLIKRADEKNIHLLHDNKTNTKAIGSIYILIDRTEYKNKITKEKIEKECGISKTTFIRYGDIIYNYYKLFKRIFKKHKISMPIEWKVAE